MTGIVNSTGARSGVIGTTVGTPASSENALYFDAKGAHANIGSAQSDYELITWQSVQQNASDFNNATGRYVAPKAGKYFFYTHAVNNDVTSVVRLYLRKNNTGGSGSDTAVQARLPADTYYAIGSIQVIYQLDVGEYVSAWTETGYMLDSEEYIGFGGYWVAT